MPDSIRMARTPFCLRTLVIKVSPVMVRMYLLCDQIRYATRNVAQIFVIRVELIKAVAQALREGFSKRVIAGGAIVYTRISPVAAVIVPVRSVAVVKITHRFRFHNIQALHMTIASPITMLTDSSNICKYIFGAELSSKAVGLSAAC